jgi:DNA-binding MarR family transcriptional regulator
MMRNRTQQSLETDLAADMIALMVFVQKSSGHEWLRLVGELDLSISQLKILIALDELDQGISVKDLAEEVGISLPAASRGVDALHCRGLVGREEDPADRRMKRVRLTDEGRAELHRLMEARLSGVEQFVHSLSPGERRAFAEALAPVMARPEVAALKTKGPCR